MHSSRSGRADLVLGLGLLVLGAVLLWGLSDISFGAGYDRIGPRFFPYVVAAGLIVLGGILGVSGWWAERARRELDGAARERLNLMPLAWIGLALVIYVALLERVGFVLASGLQFWLVARAFHSRRPGRDAVVALVLAASVYVVFSDGLGLTLPSGIFENFL